MKFAKKHGFYVIFEQPFVQLRAKMNSACYCDHIHVGCYIEQGLLADIRRLSNDDDFLFQQDTALAHRSHYTTLLPKLHALPRAGVH